MKDFERLTDKNDLYWALQEQPLSAEVGIYLTDCLNRLAELEDKIEQGKMIELPCPIRTMVYYIASLEKKIWFREKRKYCYTIMEIPFELEMLDSYGNNWFLTREEAEKRLKEIQE